MMKKALAIADNLSELVQNMQKSIQCIICLHTMTDAIRTACGHRFCRECIQMVLQNKNAACPLCNSSIHRRNIREDEHINIFINRLSKLVEAIHKDISIDVSTYVSRPRSTRESCSSDNTDTAKSEQEDYNQPGCSYSEPKPMKPASSQAKRATSKSMRSKNGKTKTNTSSDASSITKYFLKQTIPSSYSDENTTDLNVQSWLETLSDKMNFDNSNLIRPPKSKPDNTLVHSTSQNKVSTIEHEPEHIATVKDNSNSKNVISRAQKDEDGSKSMTKARESQRSSPTLISRTNEVSGRMQTDRVDQSTSGTGEDVVKERSEDRTSRDIHKTSPCDLLPSTKKNWTSVVQFGKEMRPRKIRSLNVSIGSKTNNKKSTGESVKKPAPKQKELPRRSTRRRAKGPSVADNDANEKSPVHKDRREQQSGDKNNGSMLAEGLAAGESSFVQLEQGEQVRIRNLNSHQMNDIIGVEDGQKELEIENDSDLERRRFLQEVGLYWTPSRGTKSTSIDVTPATKSRNNLESPNLLEGYVSSSVETKTGMTSEPRPAAILESSTPLPNRLSLKRRDIDSTLDDPAAGSTVSRLLAVKRDLNREIGGNAEKCVIETESTETGEKPDTNNRVENGHVRDAGTADKPESEKPEKKQRGKSLVMFKKLGKVVKHRRRTCRFLYLGSMVPRSSGVQDERLQRLCSPAKLENPPKLMSENSSGNNTRVTANNVVSQGEGNLAAGRENVTAVTALEKVLPVSKVLEIRSESPNPTVVSPHIPYVPRLNIESYDTLSKDIMSATVASELRDSNDILFVSIYEREENGTVLVHQRPPPDNTTLERTIKMLSPKNDSQLKFLSLESPTTNTQPATKQQGEDDIVVERSNLSDTRSVHSTTLVRTSRQASEGSEVDATSRKKRESSGSIFSPKGATYTKDNRTKRKHDVETNCPVGQSTRHGVIASLSSDSGTEKKEEASKEQKMAYKRIVPLAGSSSSSSEKNNTLLRRKKETGLAAKRKQSTSPDYNDVDLILNSWSKDLKPTDRFSRRGTTEGHVPAVSVNKLNQLRTDNGSAKSSSSPAIRKNTAPFKRRRLFAPDSGSNSEKPNAEMVRDSPNGRSFVEDDSPDFAATIDTIRHIQTVTLATPGNDEQSAKQKEDASLMQDNFDEIMANVDTEKLIGDYRAGPKRMHKGSDKENDYEVSGRVYNSEREREGDKTITPEHVNATDRSLTMTDDRSRCGREVCFDQDSLMDITQHQMQIKQFEDDLFGRTTTNPVRKPEDKPRTPQKAKNKADRCSDLKGQDAEHSGEEDDIVENTPTVKTKSMPTLSSSGKGSSTGSSSVRTIMYRAGSSPSSTTGSSASTVYQRHADLLYQSKPNVQAKEQAKGDCMGVANTAEKRLKAASTNEPMNRPANEVTAINDQSLVRQRLCFVCSGLVPREINQVKSLANLVNARYVDQFVQGVTHVIVKTNEENGASKTLKYLQGIAHRKWIVNYQWVIDSLRKKKLINEEMYEVVDCRTLEAGPRNSRLRHKDLFEGFAFLCIGPYKNVSVEQYEELLRATGGTVVDSLDALTATKTRMRIVVIQADTHEHEIIGWYRKARAVPILHDWIVECISQYRLVSFYQYLQELLRTDVLALGYPKFLLEDDPDDEVEDSVTE